MSDLVCRLRCKYPLGPTVDGEPEFGWRDFGGPAPDGMVLPSPLMLEAAQRIEELEKVLEETWDQVYDNSHIDQLVEKTLNA